MSSPRRSPLRPAILRLERYGVPTGRVFPLPVQQQFGDSPRVARLRAVYRQDLRLSTASGGRLEAVGITWSVGPERRVRSLLLEN